MQAGKILEDAFLKYCISEYPEIQIQKSTERIDCKYAVDFFVRPPGCGPHSIPVQITINDDSDKCFKDATKASWKFPCLLQLHLSLDLNDDSLVLNTLDHCCDFLLNDAVTILRGENHNFPCVYVNTHGIYEIKYLCPIKVLKASQLYGNNKKVL